MKFIIALGILILPVMLNDVFPKSNVFVKKESVLSSNLYLMLPVVFRKMHLSLTIGDNIEGSAQLILY